MIRRQLHDGALNGWLSYANLATEHLELDSSSFVLIDTELAHSSNLNRLLSVSPSNPYAVSGQYLASLEDLYSFRGFHWPVFPTVSGDDLCQYITAKPYKAVAEPSPTLSMEQVLEVISSASRDLTYYLPGCVAVAPLSVRLTAYAQKIAKRRFERRLRTTRRRVHRSISRFCTVSWSRRLWYLLHGSHPPKSECRQAFGCA